MPLEWPPYDDDGLRSLLDRIRARWERAPWYVRLIWTGCGAVAVGVLHAIGVYVVFPALFFWL
jgi:hypothetical protein